MDYTLWLDADDVLLPSYRQKLLALKAELDSTADVACCRTTPVLMSRADRRFSVTVSGCSKRLRTSDGRVRCTSASRRRNIRYGDAA